MSSTMLVIGIVIAIAALVAAARAGYSRLLLSRAKHPSLVGHGRIARRFARRVPGYAYTGEAFYRSDDAPADVGRQRRQAFEALARRLRERSPESIAAGERVAGMVSDMQFVRRYRVPFQYAGHVREHLSVGAFVSASAGVTLTDLDGNESLDLTGAYGVNVLGYDFYKACIAAGAERVNDLGPVLGPYHPVVEDNVRRLTEISGLDEVSFHMSGTEAVMQAVRLALYHTGRSHVVRFCGAYHGWWDGVQPGIGNPHKTGDVYTLRDMDERTLRVLRQRRDIACVLVNPLQVLHPNANAPGDGSLINSARSANSDVAAYGQWLRELRRVCTERGIVLILDEVFVGFRIAYRGAQEYFGVQADLVTYGKTLGGGLPVGVVCGRAHLMKRFRDDRPVDICFARGTFNSHPYVMATMNEFLRRSAGTEIQAIYANADEIWQRRARLFNQRLEAEHLPLRVAHFSSIFTVLYRQPSRYNWMLQFYLIAEGLTLPWIGTGRFIFSLNYTEDEFTTVVDRFVSAARRMSEGGWWWHEPSLTNQRIQRRILREMLQVKLGSVSGARIKRQQQI
ncbi:aminotransferase class III-fold pyridoxal phosphate-dependent enzyme [Salinisphaera sp. LB1]|uniref:aminotransferase class III-fold pyridoxal phosphate-dependent enzyme n=1 Tax=Salinisphaera sp. LB1 TaxID=2183911 RepID=UPI000D707D66|nr:Glutamate-1-semialdehyde aminotransferase [Salinisphaera sp. LB1]